MPGELASTLHVCQEGWLLLCWGSAYSVGELSLFETHTCSVWEGQYGLGMCVLGAYWLSSLSTLQLGVSYVSSVSALIKLFPTS